MNRNISWIDQGGDGGSIEFVPNYDIYGDGIRCGYGAAASGPGTQTLSVNAGDEIAFFPVSESSMDLLFNRASLMLIQNIN